jgi:RNA polymerase sigma factor (sigma-70 family)
MSPPSSISEWIESLRHGEPASARRLWERYYDHLVHLARDHLRGLPRRAAADEEDVALSAFAAFCEGLTHGRFPDLHDRHGLWGLLLTLTERRAADLVRREQAARRAVGRLAEGVQADDLPDEAPTPAFAAEVADEVEQRLKILDADVSGKLRQVAIWKMEGYTNAEIAQQLGCASRTVERKLSIIRELWGEEPG